ncbi:MAG: LacI family DNA-binding transcriptional regulator [Acidimicrobiales bacterium]
MTDTLPVAAKVAEDHGRSPAQRQTRRRSVTIAQLAEQSGLSTTTVSRVLNGRPDVSASSRALIEELIARHGYRKRASWSSDVPPLIDVVFERFDSPWAIEVARGALSAAQQNGLGVALTELSEARERSWWLDNVIMRGTRGVILVLSELAPLQRGKLVAHRVPFVVIDPSGEPAPEVHSVGATNWAGGLAATKHLIDLGHRRIGTITGPSDLLCSRARLDGYHAALGMAGLPVDEQLEREGDFHVEGGYRQAKALLELDQPPTAIFAANDLSALGVIRAAREVRVRVPEQLSVVGFDDLPLAEWTTPALTTVRQPLTEMAGVAVRTLLNSAETTGAPKHRVELATDLVLRESTAPPSR